MTVDNFEIYTLPSGLRCVIRSAEGPCYCQLSIGAGSRDDFQQFPGMAHFVEHTVFRGTDKRSGYQINARVEDVGGGLNAYTSRELTAYYTITPGGTLPRALELLADIVSNPAFPLAEIEREKDIIFEEIKSDIDSPEESIFDEMADFLYAGSQLGHNILGNYNSVRSIRPEDAKQFVEQMYVPQNIVLSVVAEMPLDKIRKCINRYMTPLMPRPDGRNRITPPPIEHFSKTINKDLAQSHVIMASRIFDNHDPRRYALSLLRYYLGAGMNSLLFRELREKRGYVYNIEANYSLYTDAGNFYVYYGCAKENVDKCRKLINRLLENTAENSMKPIAFERLRRKYMGREEIVNSSQNKRAVNMARMLLNGNPLQSRAQGREIMQSLTPEDLRSCMEAIISPGLNELIYR